MTREATQEEEPLKEFPLLVLPVDSLVHYDNGKRGCGRSMDNVVIEWYSSCCSLLHPRRHVATGSFCARVWWGDVSRRVSFCVECFCERREEIMKEE